jgi:chemotaxis signal transduction protein
VEWVEHELRTNSNLVTPVPVEEPVTAEERPMTPAEPAVSERSTQQHLVFELQSRRCAIPVVNVIEVVRPVHITPSGGAPDWMLGRSKLREGNIAVVDMRRFLGLDAKEGGACFQMLVRSRREDVQISFVVDEVREIVMLPDVAPQSGGASEKSTLPFLREIQHDGQLLNIVDAEQLLLSTPMSAFASPSGSISTTAESNAPSTAALEQRVGEAMNSATRAAGRLKEMTAIAQNIGDMAAQTRLMAMNASIKAASQAKGAPDFALVSGEIERMSDRCLHSSRQLLVVVESVAAEMTAAADGMQSVARELPTLAQTAERADRCLSEIEGESGRLTSLLQALSQAAEAQTRNSKVAATAIEAILGNIREMESGVAQAGQSAGSFATLTDELKGSVRVLRGKASS